MIALQGGLREQVLSQAPSTLAVAHFSPKTFLDISEPPPSLPVQLASDCFNPMLTIVIRYNCPDPLVVTDFRYRPKFRREKSVGTVQNP